MHDLLISGGTVVDGTGGEPVTADIGVKDGLVVEIGNLGGSARRIVDADGAVVMPGWIDVHTHYDGQITWDSYLEGSASNGVTTVVCGNCGVGFAPVSPDGVDTLIDLMEGVEDIPSTALYEGIPWGAWETFAEYVDFLSTREWALDVGVQLPHGSLRYYVMGERAVNNDDANAEDLKELQSQARQAFEAGALGFSTSRIQSHRARTGGNVPGTFAPEHELAAIAAGIIEGGGGVFQAIPSTGAGGAPGIEKDVFTLQHELDMFERLSRTTGLPFTFTTQQTSEAPDGWKEVRAATVKANAAGACLRPQVSARGVGALTTLGMYHMFMRRPTYLKVSHLPLAQRAAKMRDPEIRRAILSEAHQVDRESPGSMGNIMPQYFASKLDQTFALADPIDYEPDPSESFGIRAVREGVSAEELMYDFLLTDNGEAVGYLIAFNYMDGSLEMCREMLSEPDSIVGLSDAGAHVNHTCDMSNSTFMLTHWVRDRTRGERLPIEWVVAKGTSHSARLYGLRDRGVLAPGMRADINVLDLEGLEILRPELRHDLPSGNARFLQGSKGYLCTMVAGRVVRQFDTDTGERPGRLVRRRWSSTDSGSGSESSAMSA